MEPSLTSSRINLRTAPLSALRAFVVAADCGSFKLAAQQLAVTPAAISHQIQQLETYLDLRLFRRANRLVELTPAGQQLAAELQPLFAQILSSLQSLAVASHSRRHLVVSATPSLVSKWLLPRLMEFQQQHPDIEVHLMSENTPHDLLQEAQIDVVLRYGAGPYPDLYSFTLWSELSLIAVAKPGLVKYAPLAAARYAELLNYNLLRCPAPERRIATDIPGPTRFSEERWHHFFLDLGCQDASLLAQVQRGAYYSHSHLALDLACSGAGIAICNEILADDDLRQGRLQIVSEFCPRDPCQHHFLARADDMSRPEITAFSNWLKQAAQAYHGP